MRCCFFGDSFVNGVGDDDCLGWVGRLCSAERQRGRDLTVYNLGVRLDTSADVRVRWRQEAEARLRGPDGRLVFSFGLNDCAPKEDGTGPRLELDETIDNTKTILREASSWLPTLMIGPLPVTDSLDRNLEVTRLSEQIEDLCRRIGTPFLSVIPAAAALYGTWRAEAAAGDGVHPNRNSYASLARAIENSGVWRGWIGS